MANREWMKSVALKFLPQFPTPHSRVGFFKHVGRERTLGAKSARDTQRRKDRSGGDPAQANGERRSSVSLLQLSKQ